MTQQALASAFDEAFAEIIGVEGGYSDHPSDPGGATKYGITRAVLRRWRGAPVSKQDVAELDLSEAREIYRDWYWDKINAENLPSAVAVLIFDAAVNSGVKQAARFLQRAIISRSGMSLKVDGLIGPQTLLAVSRLSEVSLCEEILARRSTFYARLSTFADFGLGWNRRLAKIAVFAGKILARRHAG